MAGKISPGRLLETLKTLLSRGGGIRTEKEICRLIPLMQKYSKKLVTKVIYINILSASEATLRATFLSQNGWIILISWLSIAVESSNWALCYKILELFLCCPYPPECSRTKLFHLLESLIAISKKEKREFLYKLCCKLLSSWSNSMAGLDVFDVNENTFKESRRSSKSISNENDAAIVKFISVTSQNIPLEKIVELNKHRKMLSQLSLRRKCEDDGFEDVRVESQVKFKNVCVRIPQGGISNARSSLNGQNDRGDQRMLQNLQQVSLSSASPLLEKKPCKFYPSNLIENDSVMEDDDEFRDRVLRRTKLKRRIERSSQEKTKRLKIKEAEKRKKKEELEEEEKRKREEIEKEFKRKREEARLKRLEKERKLKKHGSFVSSELKKDSLDKEERLRIKMIAQQMKSKNGEGDSVGKTEPGLPKSKEDVQPIEKKPSKPLFSTAKNKNKDLLETLSSPKSSLSNASVSTEGDKLAKNPLKIKRLSRSPTKSPQVRKALPTPPKSRLLESSLFGSSLDNAAKPSKKKAVVRPKKEECKSRNEEVAKETLKIRQTDEGVPVPNIEKQQVFAPRKVSGILIIERGPPEACNKMVKWRNNNLVDIKFFDMNSFERTNVHRLKFSEIRSQKVREERSLLSSCRMSDATEEDARPWPSIVELDDCPKKVFYGIRSTEKNVQFQRERSVLPRVCFGEMPPNPSEPEDNDLSNAFKVAPRLILAEDISGEGTTTDFTGMEWPKAPMINEFPNGIHQSGAGGSSKRKSSEERSRSIASKQQRGKGRGGGNVSTQSVVKMKLQSPRTKTVPCKYWSRGHCQDGLSCRFLHA